MKSALGEEDSHWVLSPSHVEDTPHFLWDSVWAQSLPEGLPIAELRILPLFLCDSFMGSEATKPRKSVFMLSCFFSIYVGRGTQMQTSYAILVYVTVILL